MVLTQICVTCRDTFCGGITFASDLVTDGLGTHHAFLGQHRPPTVGLVVEKAAQLRLALQVGLLLVRKRCAPYLIVKGVPAHDGLIGE